MFKTDCPVCPKCSESHVLSQCKSSVLKCVHCTNAKATLNIENATDHAVWDPDCYVYKKTLSKFKANILDTK